MSCDWDIRCLDCNVNHGFGDANHEDDLMMALVKIAPEIAALHPTMKKLDATYERVRSATSLTINGRYSIYTEWFAAHAGHRLIAVDEYGRCYDECGEYYSYCECGHRRTCRRKTGHEGRHHDERDAEGS